MGSVYWRGPGKIYKLHREQNIFKQTRLEMMGTAESRSTRVHCSRVHLHTLNMQKRCDTQEPLLGGLAAIFILHTFFTGSECLLNFVVFEVEY